MRHPIPRSAVLVEQRLHGPTAADVSPVTVRGYEDAFSD